MGRWAWSNRYMVEECRTIDIPFLSRHGFFSGLASGIIEWMDSTGKITSSIGIEVSVRNHYPHTNYIKFEYTHINCLTEEKTDLNYSTRLAMTRCNFGGVRYWFICGLKDGGRCCGKRVGKLYLPPNSTYFGCRKCHDLTYRSQKQHDKNVSALLKSPAMMDLVSKGVEAGDFKSASLIMKAYFKLISKR